MDEMDDKPAFLANAARLQRAYFDRDTELVARELLGCLLVHRSDGVERIGRIVETEAYLGVEALAAHSSKGITPRTRIMFGPAGYAYVYLIYGMHHCVNVVTGPAGEGSAVLLRALEPLEGLEVMRRRRGRVERDRLLASGPGRLTQAFGINHDLDAQPMRRSDVVILAKDPMDTTVEVSHRVGITKAVDWPLRFTQRGSHWVSK